MTDVLLVYITCKDHEQAKQIGEHLLNKRLCGCINIIPGMQSVYFWPPKQNVFERGDEVVLIVKTLEAKYDAVEKETLKIHSYTNPCILSIPVTHVSKKYYDWLVEEMS